MCAIELSRHTIAGSLDSEYVASGSSGRSRHRSLFSAKAPDATDFAATRLFQLNQLPDKNMTTMRRSFLKQTLSAAAVAATLVSFSNLSLAATAEDLNKDAAQALQTLYKTNPFAESVSKKARAVLVFPKIVKAGLVFGGAYGEGVLLKGGQHVGYFNSVAASWGWQAGAESYSYAVFLMNDKAVTYLDKSKGWEFGVGPTVVVVNEGVAKNLSTSTMKDDAYAFIFDQTGLMASLSIEGTKISHIKR